MFEANAPESPSVVDEASLHTLHEQSTLELEAVSEKINTLEALLHPLATLKQRQAQLQRFKESLALLLSPNDETTSCIAEEEASLQQKKSKALLKRKHAIASFGDYAHRVFLPEKAFAEADDVLRYRHSINYEFFKAIVLNGGCATTQQVKHYLVEQAVKTQQGKTFEQASLSEISARMGYLVKRGVVTNIAPGQFVSCLGWQ
jgi:hypothetical protein